MNSDSTDAGNNAGERHGRSGRLASNPVVLAAAVSSKPAPGYLSRSRTVATLLAILAAGGLFAWWTAARADSEMRANLLQQTRLVAKSVKVESVKALTGTEADLDAAGYLQLKEQLAAVRSANPQCRFVYLSGRKANGTVFFFVDSEPAGSKDYSPPGQIYEEVPEAYRRVFDTKAEVAEGPVADRWGVWVSGLVPLTDPATGAVVAVLGMDTAANDWKWTVAAQTALPVGLMLVLLIGGTTVFVSTRRVRVSYAPVLRRLLAPLAAMVVLLMVGAGAILWQQQQRNLTREIVSHVSDVSGDLRVALNQQALGLDTAAQPIAADAAVQKALREGDADRLLAAWRPLFETMHRKNSLTHLYFFDKNRVCLLRVHKPEKRGDLINRFTALEAERTGKTASGIELGPLGTFTLRVVQPVFEGGTLVGYVELGKEIEDVLQSLYSHSGNQLAVVIRKEHLKRQDWEDGMRLLGREVAWDRLSRSVVTYASQGHLPEAFAAWADQDVHSETDREITCEEKDWRVAVTPLQDASGKEVGDLLILHDITADKEAFARVLTLGGMAGAVLLASLMGFLYVLLRRTDRGIRAQQAALTQITDRLSLAVRAGGVGIWDYDVVNSTLVWDDQMFLLYGITADQFGGAYDAWRAKLHPEDVQRGDAEIQRALRGEKEFNTEFRVVWPNGSIHHIRALASVQRDASGQPVRMTGTNWDITDQKQSEKSLFESEEKHRLLVEHSHDVIYTLTSDGVFSFVSPAWTTLLGHTASQVVGQPFQQFVHPDDVPGCLVWLRKVIETGQRQRGIEYRVRHVDGAWQWHTSSAVPLRNEAGAVIGFEGTARDITERKLAEDAKREALDRLQRIASRVPGLVYQYCLRPDGSSCMPFANEAIREIFRLSPEEVREDASRIFALIHQDDHDGFVASIQASARDLTPWHYEYRVQFDDGIVLWQLGDAIPQREADGSMLWHGFVTDITERKKAEVYRDMGREVLQILNEPGDGPYSLQRVLAVLKTRTGLDAVGIRLQDGDDFPYFTQEGFSKEFLLTENTLVERTADGGVCRDKDGNVSLECTCGLVLSGKTDPANPLFTPTGSVWTNDSFSLLDLPSDQDPRHHPRNHCIHHGYASVALVPIRNQDRIVGLIHLNDRRKGCFTLATVELLEGIASHIGAALMRKQAEEARCDREVQFRSLFDNATAGIAIQEIVLDDCGKPADYIFIQVNRAFETQTGLRAEDVIGKRYAEVFPSVGTVPFVEMYSKVALTGAPITFEHFFEPLQRHYSVTAYQATNGQFVTAFDDITDRKNAEAAIERARNSAQQEAGKLSAMIASMEEGVVFADADGVIVEINEFLCRFAGKSRQEILGRRIENIHVGPVKENIVRLIEKFRREIGSRPFTMQRAIGPTEVLLRMQPIYREGLYDGVLLNVIDVTELIAARQEVEKTNLQLEAAVARANEMAALAETASIVKSEFLANMSHEIRTPLTAILGYSELLIEEKASLQERQEHSRVILRNGRHLLELVNDILDISKIEADKLVLEQRPVSVHAVVADVVSMMRVRAIEKQLALTARYLTPMPRTILTDEARLRQALINLVGNAIKFTQAGEVSISVSLVQSQQDTPSAVRIEVQDTGIGMSPETIKELFHPFVQADSSTTRKFGGTGLGLTITKRILEKMGGQVQVQSALGQGSTFTMIVPTGSLEGIALVKQASEAMAEITEAPSQPERALPLQGLRILLAEDGPDNQLLIRTVLSKAGAEVEVVANGLLAVQAAAQRPFDVVLMDMQMPEMDGYEATGQLRAQGYGVPVVALTAHALSSDRARCIDAGCTDYLTKPIDRIAMIDLILKHTSRQQPATAGAVAIQPLPAAAAIASQFADDKDLAEIIELFVRQLPQRCQGMREALSHSDLPTLGRLAHQMKGAGGSYGYPMLTQAGKELESAAKAGDPEACGLQLHALAVLCQAVGRGLKTKEISREPS